MAFACADRSQWQEAGILVSGDFANSLSKAMQLAM